MSFFRIKHLDFEKKFNVLTDIDTLDMSEWKNVSRIQETSWNDRYDYESKIILDAIKDFKPSISSILEVGSGPGILGQKIQQLINIENYHFVDKPFAQKYFTENNLKGTFFIKDISVDLDTSGLLQQYDLIICNDTLEHVLAPSNIIKRFYELTNKDSIVFISVPNWRMGHQFVYRGLWDYDNFLYFMYVHGFESITVYPSILITQEYPKLDSESEMPDELIQSWNWYFVLKHRQS
jgi:2-polyprenyl-3-methyl-5-hydroxy-6-metoxy-1,4-benzoquinol methylase